MGQHDLSYRAFFSHRRMIQDLLREIVGERWVERVDFDSGRRMETSFVSPRHENRESDVIWEFRRKDGDEPVFVYILLEFQSRPDPAMPVRIMGYESHFYQMLMASRPAADWKKLPLVIPIVVYNGTGPWNVATDLGSLIGDLDPSAEIYRPQLRYRLVDAGGYPQERLAAIDSPVAGLFRMEKGRDWRDVRAGFQSVTRSLPPTEASLRQAFATWIEKVVLPRLGPTRDEAAEPLTLEEVDTMLAENIDRWSRELREEGRQEGRLEARQEGEAAVLLRLLGLKFGPLAPEVEERVRSADEDRLLEWTERILSAQSLNDVLRE